MVLEKLIFKGNKMYIILVLSLFEKKGVDPSFELLVFYPRTLSAIMIKIDPAV